MYQADSPGQGRTTQFVITRHDGRRVAHVAAWRFATRSPTLDRRPDRSPGASTRAGDEPRDARGPALRAAGTSTEASVGVADRSVQPTSACLRVSETGK